MLCGQASKVIALFLSLDSPHGSAYFLWVSGDPRMGSTPEYAEGFGVGGVGAGSNHLGESEISTWTVWSYSEWSQSIGVLTVPGSIHGELQSLHASETSVKSFLGRPVSFANFFLASPGAFGRLMLFPPTDWGN